MALSHIFPAQRRKGVSELYASMLMIGVTLSVGSMVAAAAVGQFSQATNAAAMGASIHESAIGMQLNLVYAAAAPTGSCPSYQGYKEGTSLTVSLFNYGDADFAPAVFFVNSTAYAGTYAPLAAGTMGTYVISLVACAHYSGLTVLALDSAGDGVQVES
jgi:hypothetical protein